MGNIMSTYTIGETAKLLKISKKTLMRWDELGKFPSIRDANNFRRYDKKMVDAHVLWFSIRRKHKEHLRMLKSVRDEVDKYTRTAPITDRTPPRLFNYEEMKKAYDDLQTWESKERAIIKEYSILPKGFRHLIDPEL